MQNIWLEYCEYENIVQFLVYRKQRIIVYSTD